MLDCRNPACLSDSCCFCPVCLRPCCVLCTHAARVTSYVSSKAGKDSLSSHVDAVVAKKTMSEFGDFGTPRSNLTGFTGACHADR